jgi:hypothetical protein
MSSINSICTSLEKENKSRNIFLQPIDQQYFKNSKYGNDEYGNFFQEFDLNPFNLLDISTDSETESCRKSSVDDDLLSLENKFTFNILKEDWQKSIKEFKQSQKERNIKQIIERNNIMKKYISNQLHKFQKIKVDVIKEKLNSQITMTK